MDAKARSLVNLAHFAWTEVMRNPDIFKSSFPEPDIDPFGELPFFRGVAVMLAVNLRVGEFETEIAAHRGESPILYVDFVLGDGAQKFVFWRVLGIAVDVGLELGYLGSSWDEQVRVSVRRA